MFTFAIDQRLIAAIEQLKAKDIGLYLAATGGGAGIQNILWRIPGASRFLFGATFPYDQGLFHQFIGRLAPEGQSLASNWGAVQLAFKAKGLVDSIVGRERALGLGVSCALQTDRQRRGHDRICIAVAYGGEIYADEFRFTGSPPFTREEQGAYADILATLAVLEAVGIKYSHPLLGIGIESKSIVSHSMNLRTWREVEHE